MTFASEAEQVMQPFGYWEQNNTSNKICWKWKYNDNGDGFSEERRWSGGTVERIANKDKSDIHNYIDV
jgi:hypothetical protein